ncbi:MAG: gephyrin-like molybdotransferase Glp [Chitinophagales bacterium]
MRLEEARRILQDLWPSPTITEVPLIDSLGKTLADNVIAAEDLPPFGRSTVDGFAVKAEDTFGASEGLPAFLTYSGEVMMGEAPQMEIEKGECVWIPTGGMLPRGTDSVVMVEYTDRLGEDTILITRPVSPGENVIRPGEDCASGDVALPGGQVMRPQDIGVAAALGLSVLKVNAPIKVGIISTGDEIVDIDKRPTGAQVRDVNSYTLAAGVIRRGGIPAIYGVVPDDFESLRRKTETALLENDCLLLSGGSSVGTRDFSLQVLQSFEGCRVLFHGLSVKPGKPTLGVSLGNGKVVVGLPGHPVSALMIFNVLLGPLMSKGIQNLAGAVLSDSIASQPGRDDFVRVRLFQEEERMIATPVYGKAGLIRIMSQADGFIHIPYEKQGINKGDPVIVQLF